MGSRRLGADFRYAQRMFRYPTTAYFRATRARPDRSIIEAEWILRAVESPERRAVQADGRIRVWKTIPEMNGRVLRVVLLPDGRTIHNAFFDRSFREESI